MIALLLVVAGAHAADSDAFERCAVVAEAVTRLACFDGAVASRRLLTGQRPGTSVEVTSRDEMTDEVVVRVDVASNEGNAVLSVSCTERYGASVAVRWPGMRFGAARRMTGLIRFDELPPRDSEWAS